MKCNKNHNIVAESGNHNPILPLFYTDLSQTSGLRGLMGGRYRSLEYMKQCLVVGFQGGESGLKGDGLWQCLTPLIIYFYPNVKIDS